MPKRIASEGDVPRNDHFQDITVAGNISPGDLSRVDNSLIPANDNTEDLGTYALRWRNVYAGTIYGTIAGAVDCSAQSGSDAGAKLQACHDALSATDGGIMDARGITGAQTAASTITISKPSVTTLLGPMTLTCSGNPCLDVTAGADGGQIIGIGIGSSTTGGTRIRAASGTPSPIVRLAGSAAGTRLSVFRLEKLTIESTTYTAAQIGLLAQNAGSLQLHKIQFAEVGQAEDINDVYGMEHREVNYFHSGSGDTAATATVRVENRANPSPPNNNIMFYDCLWQGDETGVTNKDGIALYIGPANDLVTLVNSHMDYNSATVAMDKRVIVIEKADNVHAINNWISAANASGPTAVIVITGDGSDSSIRPIFAANTIFHSSTVPAYYADYASNGQLALGDVIAAGGTGTQITLTANSGALVIGPYSNQATPTTPVSDSGTGNSYMHSVTGAMRSAVMQFGTGNFPTTGIARFANASNLTWRNAANNADFFLGLNSGDQLQTSAAIRTNVGIGVNRASLSNGLAMLNDIPIYFRNAANSADIEMKINSSDQLVFPVAWPTPGAIGGGTPAAGTFTTLTANTSLVIAGGTALTTTNQTGTGSLVLATSPTLVTPVLGVATGTSFQGIIGNVTPAAGTFTTLTATGAATAETYATETNCSSSASPAVCADAAAGSVVIAAAATTVVVNTTKVTANSQIIITEDSSLGTKLSVTCNTTLARNYAITARTAATSFTITTDVAPVTNPACLSFALIN